MRIRRSFSCRAKPGHDLIYFLLTFYAAQPRRKLKENKSAVPVKGHLEVLGDDLVTVSVKRAVGPKSAICLPPRETSDAIRLGVLTALDHWVNGRDHDAEWKKWEGFLAHISDAVTQLPTVKTTMIEPLMRSNWAPTMDIIWDQAQIKISPRDVNKKLLEGEPRIAVAGSNPHEEWRLAKAGQPGPDPRPITIMPFQMVAACCSPPLETSPQGTSRQSWSCPAPAAYRQS